MARRVGLLVMAVSLWGQAFGLSDWSAVAQRAKNSVVKIIARTKKGEATGTGFAVSADGKVATNYHVIEGASKIFVKLPNGRTVGVQRVIASDKRVDLAILQVRGVSLRPLPLGDSSAVKVGQEVCVIGAPLGLDLSLSTGVVSAKRSLGGIELVQITAPISSGSSGSPVLDRSGRVIGVVSLTITEAQNLNFALSVKHLKVLLSKQPNKARGVSLLPAKLSSKARVRVSSSEELVKAIYEVKNGGEVEILPGVYQLSRPIFISKSINIIGSGSERTVLMYEGDFDCMINLSGSGTWTIRDVTLIYNGTAQVSHVIRALGEFKVVDEELKTALGELRLFRCTVSGGVGRKDILIGSGIYLFAYVRATIRECNILNNEIGVIAMTDTEAVIESCKILENLGLGIIVRGACEVKHSEFLRNQGTGMLVIWKGRLVAYNNVLEENAGSGIELQNSAEGEIVGNTCRNNGTYGIYAQDQSRLFARNNTCEGNSYSGIALFGNVQGEVEGNRCVNNEYNGIYIHESSVKAAVRNNTDRRAIVR